MRWLFVASLASAASVVSFLACSSSDDVTPPASSSGGSFGDAGGSTGGDDGDTPPGDGGVKLSPTGCPLVSTPMTPGTKIENLARAGAVDWKNPSAALNDDGTFAEVTLNDGQESAELRVSDFKLALPSTAETWGIVVELKRQTTTDGGFVQTGQVNVEIEGKTSNYKFDVEKFFWPTKIVGRHGYGQEVDTWGTDLFPADVNRPTFAAKLWARRVAGKGVSGPVTATVESLRVQVWYCAK